MDKTTDHYDLLNYYDHWPVFVILSSILFLISYFLSCSAWLAKRRALEWLFVVLRRYHRDGRILLVLRGQENRSHFISEHSNHQPSGNIMRLTKESITNHGHPSSHKWNDEGKLANQPAREKGCWVREWKMRKRLASGSQKSSYSSFCHCLSPSCTSSELLPVTHSP